MPAAKETVIYEIRNLTTGEVIVITPGFKSDRFEEKISATLTAAPAPASSKTDNIQVLWGKLKSNSTTEYVQTYKGVNGSLTYDEATKKVTISGLQDVSKISLGITGILEIGPKLTPEQIADPALARKAAAQVSVSVGNLNRNKEWIIDFSSKKNGMPGTSIELNTLIDWIGDQAPGLPTEIDMPKDENKPKDPAVPETSLTEVKNFKILFNEFHFNITSKTFKFDVRSEADQSITFGNFTIKKVGFLVTNEPYEEVPAIIEI